MSSMMESLLDRTRLADCLRNDMAYGITVPTVVHVSGRHLSDAPNEPTTFRDIEEQANADARAIVAGRVDGIYELGRAMSGSQS